MSRNTLIFIGGVHKSGTSMLHEILRSHPSISGFQNTGVPEDEGQLLQTVYPPAYEFGGAGRFGFHPESFMDEQHPLATEENAENLFNQWSEYWNLDKPYLIEKSPPNIVKTRFLQKIFPLSRFIIILRHPIPVAYATRKWRTTSISSLVDHTLRCYERFLADRPFLKSVYLFRYEEFVQNPGKHLEEIWSWLGLEPWDVEYEVRRDSNQRYFDEWSEDRRVTGRVLKWEDRAGIFGYSLKNPGKLLPLQFTGYGYSSPLPMKDCRLPEEVADRKKDPDSH